MNTRVLAQPVTLLEHALDRLEGLCHVLEYPRAEARAAADLFGIFAANWRDVLPTAAPTWPSDITDDHTPFEFSLVLGGATPELRFLLEAQGASPTLASNWDAARSVNQALARDYAVDLNRLSAIEELFTPTAACPRFAMWHAVCLKPGAAPDFKLYLNPQAQGAANARAVIEAAMRRLGFAQSCLPASLGPEDELCYLALDLTSRSDARVKIYMAHHAATFARIEAIAAAANGYVPGRAATFVRALAGCADPFDSRPILTCLSFVHGSDKPTTATVHFPVRSYAKNDNVVQERVLDYVPRPSAALYRSALNTFARRPLAAHSGIQSYVSERLTLDATRLTVYLAPEIYAVEGRRASAWPPRSSPPAPASRQSGVNQ